MPRPPSQTAKAPPLPVDRAPLGSRDRAARADAARTPHMPPGRRDRRARRARGPPPSSAGRRHLPRRSESIISRRRDWTGPDDLATRGSDRPTRAPSTAIASAHARFPPERGSAPRQALQSRRAMAARHASSSVAPYLLVWERPASSACSLARQNGPHCRRGTRRGSSAHSGGASCEGIVARLQVRRTWVGSSCPAGLGDVPLGLLRAPAPDGSSSASYFEFEFYAASWFFSFR